MGDGCISKFFQGCLFLLAVAFVASLTFLEFLGEREGAPYGVGFIIFGLSLTTVFVFAPFFDEIKLGKILELKRKVQKQEAENEKLEQKNEELLKQIIHISNSFSQSQKQSNITYNGLTEELLTKLGVIKASEEEVEQLQEENVTGTDRQRDHQERIARYERFKILEQKVASLEITQKGGVQEVKFNSVFDVIDPIMSDKPIIFDGYIQSPSEEIFIEIMRNYNSFHFFDRLYVMLNKIYLYKNTKNKNAFLRLVLIDQNNDDGPIARPKANERINRWFLPAIKSGLLKVQIYSEEEIDRIPEPQGTLL